MVISLGQYELQLTLRRLSDALPPVIATGARTPVAGAGRLEAALALDRELARVRRLAEELRYRAGM